MSVTIACERGGLGRNGEGPGSEEINPQARGAHAFAHARRIPIVASADDHTESDAEISDAPDWSTNVRALLRALEPEAIVIYGVATDFCDKYKYRRRVAAGLAARRAVPRHRRDPRDPRRACRAIGGELERP